MIKRRKNITDPKQTILIVCATEAEALYFSQMRKDCRYVNLTVLTSPKQDIKALIDYTGRERSRGRFDSAWALFGFDDVSIDKDGLKEVEEVAERKKVKLCWFNPSFELWFAFHLTAPSSFTTDLAPYMNKLRESFPGFALTPEYFLTKGLNVDIRLFPRRAAADINARNYNTVARQATGIDASRISMLLEDVTAICGKADMSHNQRVRR